MGLLRSASLKGHKLLQQDHDSLQKRVSSPDGASLASASSSSRPNVHSAKTSPLYSYLLKNAGLGDSSFKKTQECLRVVAKEFKFHGYKLEGPCAAVKKAGTNGKFVRNIARDVRRRSSQLHKDQVPTSSVDVPIHKDRGENGIESRKFPIILPHLLLPWLQRNGLFTQLGSDDLSNYWRHMRNRGVDIAKLVPPELESSMNPLYLWADDAVYNSRHEKIMTILIGHILDEESFSIQTCWPICTIRVELSIGFPTLYAFLEPVVESMNTLFLGVAGMGNSTIRGIITEIRGDWKFQAEWLNLATTYKSVSICYQCRANKNEFMRAPSQLTSSFRHDVATFHRECLKAGPKSPLCSLPGFAPSCVKWCSMHVINLGVCLWSCGSTLRVLLDQYPHLWSGDVLKSDNDRLAIAYEEFRAWTRQQKIPHSQPRFTSKRLVSWQHPYPELQAKAYNARVVTAWLARELVGLVTNAPDDAELILVTKHMWNLAHWFDLHEAAGRYLSDENIQQFTKACDDSMGAYIKLAHRSVSEGKLLWPSRPKHHGWQEILHAETSERQNSRFYHGFRCEDWVGRVTSIAAKCHRANMEGSLLDRYYLGLFNHNQAKANDGEISSD